jgi:hypothetical protein
MCRIGSEFLIIAAYAGTGKTTLAKKRPDEFVDFICMPYKFENHRSLCPRRHRDVADKGIGVPSRHFLPAGNQRRNGQRSKIQPIKGCNQVPLVNMAAVKCAASIMYKLIKAAHIR